MRAGGRCRPCARRRWARASLPHLKFPASFATSDGERRLVSWRRRSWQGRVACLHGARDEWFGENQGRGGGFGWGTATRPGQVSPASWAGSRKQIEEEDGLKGIL